MAKIRVTRILIYEGEESWVRDTLDSVCSFIQPDRPYKTGFGVITELERTEEPVND